MLQPNKSTLGVLMVQQTLRVETDRRTRSPKGLQSAPLFLPILSFSQPILPPSPVLSLSPSSRSTHPPLPHLIHIQSSFLSSITSLPFVSLLSPSLLSLHCSLHSLSTSLPLYSLSTFSPPLSLPLSLPLSSHPPAC